jgi:CCR4-NOT transcription complex subunit 6
MSFEKEKESALNGFPPFQNHFYNANPGSSSPSVANSQNFHAVPVYANTYNRYSSPQQQQLLLQKSSQTTETTPSTTSVHVTRQLTYAQNSRQSSTPHHHARTAAAMARSTPASSTVIITDPNNPGRVFNRVDNVSSSLVEEDQQQTWTTLDIGGLGLKQISPTLCSYSFLTVLYMNHNNLTNLTSDIAKLVNLRTLDCSGNKLSSLPPELGMLIHLRDLLLFDNNLVNLPSELGTLYQLEMLGLEGNPLQADLKNLLMKEGTQAVIISLRENAPGKL